MDGCVVIWVVFWVDVWLYGSRSVWWFVGLWIDMSLGGMWLGRYMDGCFGR